MTIKLLLGFNLVLLALLLAVTLTAKATDLMDSAHYWRQSKANQFEWTACETKHRILLKQIRNEGLWNRLGMPGQAWLR